ncbi:cytochrome b/b6 domain-containing protein [Rhodocyclus tenuis]|uniref:cytochrome b/b6 domain-containing protein n=1 Tax=Rhodocyclus tenuis TaxID=1066 RepID=UPI0019035ED4
MSGSTYTRPAVLLHWLQAIIVVWLFWLGWTMTDLPKGAERSAAYALHKSLGLLSLLLVVVRLAWRSTHRPPAGAAGWEGWLARASQHALYFLLLAVPLAGYFASAFTPYAISFFGVELPRISAPDAASNAVGKQLHVALVWACAALIGLHLLGALKIASRRDGAWKGMLPARLFSK